jgi:hypothetical protein
MTWRRLDLCAIFSLSLRPKEAEMAKGQEKPAKSNKPKLSTKEKQAKKKAKAAKKEGK